MDSLMSYHTCKVCHSVFTCLAKYQQHRSEHAQAENIKLYTCSACEFVSDSEYSFKEHKMSHGEPIREHRCAICFTTEMSWNSLFHAESAISADELRLGKRSIATQFCNEDDEETEEEEIRSRGDFINDQPDEQETEVEDDADTEIEEYVEDNYSTNDSNNDVEQESVYQNGNDTGDAEKIQEKDDFVNHEPSAQIDHQKHPNDHNHRHNNYDYSFSSKTRKNKKASKKAATKRKNGKKVPDLKSTSSRENTDIYDFRSDDDAHVETTSAKTKTFSRSPLVSLAPGTPSGTAQPAATHLALGSQTIPPNTQLFQPAATLPAFFHPPPPHAHFYPQHPTYIRHHFSRPDAFPMPQQAFFTLPHPQAPGGPFPRPPGAQQFIHNHSQFSGQPGKSGQFQLLSIPANMQNEQLQQPIQQFSHLSQAGLQLSAPEMNGQSQPACPINNQHSDDDEGVKTQERSTPSSPVKAKGHGKGNRKPRMKFVSLGNGSTIGSDGIERKFHCSLCGNGKSFKTKSHLGRHMLTHTGEKPYKCDDCGLKFNQSSSLRNHVIALHTKQFPHMCAVCEKGFLMPAMLAKHIKQTGHMLPAMSC